MPISLPTAPAAIHAEFAHVYADETFGQEHEQGVKELTSYLKNRPTAETIITSVLIDESNPTKATLNEQEFLSEIAKRGAPVDFTAYESQFVNIADQIISELPREHLRFLHFREREVVALYTPEQTIGLKEFTATSRKHTCALLSTAWTLCRLGAFPFPVGSILARTGKVPQAEKILTFLPKKYQATEEKVKQIIAATKFRPLLAHIEYHFF
jgi:hypothetical protein